MIFMGRIANRIIVIFIGIILLTTPLFLVNPLGKKITISDFSNDFELTVHIIDIGQGDSILIKTPLRKYILIDVGERSYSSKLINYLQNENIYRIDAFFATHPHADHIGGAKEIFDNFEILSVYEPGYPYDSATYNRFIDAVENENCPLYTDDDIDPGDYVYVENGVDLQVLAINKAASNTNDASIVLRLDYGRTSFLFTGDINGDQGDYVESYLVDNWDVNIDILKVSHHGSSHASTDYFLSEATPETSIISCGTGNSYGHPHHETITRLSNHGSLIYRTDLNGNIVINTDGISYNVNYDKPKEKPTNPIINGPTIINSGVETFFDISSSDPNEKNLFYYIDWCDGTIAYWIGPYESGEIVSINHLWTLDGTYIIRAKAKNENGIESDWTSYSISMSKEKVIKNLFYSFLNKFFNSRFLF